MPTSKKLDKTIFVKYCAWEPLGSPINYKYKNSSEQRNDVTKKYQNFLFEWGEYCQALECGRARYLRSRIALLFVAGQANDVTS